MNTLSRILEESITNGVRTLRTGGETYDHFFTGHSANEKDKMVAPDGEVDDTLRVMQQVVHTYIDDTKDIALSLQKSTVPETLRAIWEFLYYNIQYKNDVKGIEQLRRPSRSWADRKTGVDCDDFAMFASSILVNLNIPHSFRIAAYSGGFWQHVYVVVPKPGGNLDTAGAYWTIDAVLSAADYEKPFSKKQDYKVIINSLNGMEIDILSGLDNDENLGRARSMFRKQGMPHEMRPVPIVRDAVMDMKLANDLDHAVMGPRIEGLGDGNDEEYNNRVFAWLVATRNTTAANRAIVLLTGENPTTFLQMLDYAIKYWHTDARDTALTVLHKNEARLNELNGYADLSGIEGFEDDSLYGDDEMFLNGFEGLGKLFGKKDKSKPKKKGLFAKIGGAIKKTAQKVGGALKKAAKFVLIKANPLVIAARAGFLLAVKLNIGKMAAKLKWAYATPQQAAAAHVAPATVSRAKQALTKIESLFADKLGGKRDALKNAVLKSKGGKLSGFDGIGDVEDNENYLGTLDEEGFSGALGFLPAAGLAAAVPVITAVVKILKDSGLIGKNEKVDPQADISAASGSAGGDGEDASQAPPSSDDETDSYAPETQPAYQQDAPTDDVPEDNPVEQGITDSTDDLNGLGGITDVVGSFVKNNPVVAGGVVMGVGLLLYSMAGSGGTSRPAAASPGLGSARTKKAPVPHKKAKPRKVTLR